jgi:two-component system, NarL family, response regulator DegU
MNSEIRIVIADDHPVVRRGLREMIETDSMLKVVAEAGDGKHALEIIERLRPEVAVLDLDMPEMDGFAVVREVQRKNLAVEVIILTIHREEEIFQEAMDLGVRGYVLKDSATTDIISSIRSAAARQPYISPQLSAFLLSRRRRVDALATRKPGLESLTTMERRILKLIANEKTSKDIAAQLFISHRTVETHRTNICRKLDLKGNLPLIKFALTHKSEL